MKPKILIIASYAKSLIDFRLHLMQAFIAKGYEVLACAPDDAEVAMQLAQYHIQFMPIKLKRTGLNPLRDFAYLYSLFKIMRRERPSMVFSYTIKPVIYGSLVAKLSGIKQIYSMITGMGYVFSNASPKSKVVGTIAQALFKHTLKFNRRIFFQNEDNLQTFLDRSLIKHRNQSVLINGSGVDINSFLPTPYANKLTFLMVARLLKDKGVREYFQAAKQVKAGHPEIEFLLVGWIDNNPNAITEDELQSYINSNVITYLGEMADVRPAIAQSSVFVLPSYGEGTPRSVLEAMAMGRPIITTDVPGCRQTVVPKKNGFLVPAKKIDDLVAAMYKFIHNPEIIAEMGAASREMAIDKYDVNKVNASILAHMIN